MNTAPVSPHHTSNRASVAPTAIPTTTRSMLVYRRQVVRKDRGGRSFPVDVDACGRAGSRLDSPMASVYPAGPESNHFGRDH
jgi:hypothetical protein